jgi:hypothetical protein
MPQLKKHVILVIPNIRQLASLDHPDRVQCSRRDPLIYTLLIFDIDKN